MPTLLFNIKLTDGERAILRRQAKKSGLTEADHLRVCMLVDAVVEGDMQAIKLTAGRMRKKFVSRMRIWERREVKAT